MTTKWDPPFGCVEEFEMAAKVNAPGWIARCRQCPFEIDLESLGWTRIGAYSWGKRHPIDCPDCGKKRWMRIVHVDEDGNPDQSLGKVLAVIFLMQVIIAAVVIGILMAVGVIPRFW